MDEGSSHLSSRSNFTSRKLSPWFMGPFLIESQVNEVSYKLKLPPDLNIAPVFHVLVLDFFALLVMMFVDV